MTNSIDRMEQRTLKNIIICLNTSLWKQYKFEKHLCKFNQHKLMIFSSRPCLIKLAALNYLLYIIPFQLVILIVNSCNVHVLYKIIFTIKLDLFWIASLFLYNFYSYFETSGGQSSNLFLNIAFFNTSVNQTSVAAEDSCCPPSVSNMSCTIVTENKSSIE